MHSITTVLFAVSCTLVAACAGATATVDSPAVNASECALPYTRVGVIQGTGDASPVQGRTVSTIGVVVADFEGAPPKLGGFYLQDPDGDGDAATSDGIFVSNGARDDVAVGDIVRVTGTAGEDREQTRLEAAGITACGTGSVQATEVALPLATAADLERYEGMVIRLPQRLYVTEHYQLGRFNEIVLSSGGRLPQPTEVAAPGAPARAVQAANDLNRIILDDASYEQNPAIVFGRGGAPLDAGNTLRGGDHVTDLTGVLTQTSAGSTGVVTYRIRPVLPGAIPDFVAANARTADPPDVGGTLRVASFNLLNYFNTFTGCTAGVGGAETDCRGADDAEEFDRQWRKSVAAIAAMDADIIGIVEVENDGYAASSAIADVVTRLNAATSPGRYALIDVDAGTGTVNALGTDAIKVAMIYRPATVTPVGRTAVLATRAFVQAGDGVDRNRPTLAQAFTQSDGGRVVVSISHLKSKGGACDVRETGDGQGECSMVRTSAARELVTWLGSDPTGAGTAHILIMGDLNAYALEDPITAITGAGYTDLLREHAGAGSYSYAFGGQWGRLDHALASRELVPHITGAAAWHINADEPPVLDYNTNFKSSAQRQSLYRASAFRSSDHDPVIVGLRLDAAAINRR